MKLTLKNQEASLNGCLGAIKMSEKKDVSSDEKLLRWLHPSQFYWPEKRATSAAFKDPYMSVDINSLTTLYDSYQRAVSYGKTAVVSIKASDVYSKEQRICECPTSIEPETENNVCIYDTACKAFNDDASLTKESLKIINPAHACVIGNKTKSISKFFAAQSEVEIYPPNNKATE